MIANVVGNALVHTDVAVPVTIRVERHNLTATISVEDRGQGMTTAVAERVTERSSAPIRPDRDIAAAPAWDWPSSTPRFRPMAAPSRSRASQVAGQRYV